MAQRLGKARASGKPTASVARKIGILLDLVRNRKISLSGCMQTYQAKERTILRDLQELRAIGNSAGFRISEREGGDLFTLSEFKARPAGMVASQKRLRGLMSEIFKALGEPVHALAEGLRDGAVDHTDSASFLHLVLPQLVDGSAVRGIYDELDAAWQNDARVEFTYKAEKRVVEPATAIVRSGRYYLIGRDIAKGRNGWRTFSMDLIKGPIRRVGTFTRKPPPAKYISKDAIGFFKGDSAPQTVEVTFSKALATTAASRKWQHSQEVRNNRDGTVTIVLAVDDVDEVVRWALGFGDEAWISAPPAVVTRAKETVARIRRRYE